MNAAHEMHARNNRAIALWLLVVCALIFAMIVLGGVTRLTRSGLSMVEWDPIMGVFPPLSQEQWQETFDKYKQFPEYQKLNRGMSLAEFKGIFWFEYGHRMLGRTIGLAFLLPFLYFWIRKKIGRQLFPKLIIMFILGGLQGLLGWYMVKSGLVDKPHVSQYRLTAHLAAAIAIYGYILWVALGLLRPATRGSPDSGLHKLKRLGIVVTVLICVMILSGGFVAGTKAGFAFNTFPTMDGHWLPPGGLALQPAWLNLFENLATVQFTHRVLALVVATAVILYWFIARSTQLPNAARKDFHLLVAVLAVQLTLGILTLLYVVPVPLAALHQAGALVLFTSALLVNHRLHRVSSSV